MSDVFIYWTETKTQVAASVKNEPLYYNLIHEAPCEGFPDLIETHNETHVNTQTNIGAKAEKFATNKKTVETQTGTPKVKKDTEARAVIKETRVVKEFRLVEGRVPFTDDDDLFSRLDRWERIYLSQVMIQWSLLSHIGINSWNLYWSALIGIWDWSSMSFYISITTYTLFQLSECISEMHEEQFIDLRGSLKIIQC